MPDRDYLLFVQRNVLSRQQALRFWTPAAIRHRLKRDLWQHPHRGVYVASPAGLTRHQKRWIAVLAAVEIDGVQHVDARQAWADMKRQNDLWVSGLCVLRFPSFLVRARPNEVIEQVRRALIAGGWEG